MTKPLDLVPVRDRYRSSSPRKNSTQVLLNEAELALVEQACDVLDTSRSAFGRRAILKEAAAILEAVKDK